MKTDSLQAIVREATSFMQANLSRSLTVGDIAKAVGYSERHLVRAFKKVTGHDAKAFLLILQIEKSKRLLGETELSVTEAAFEAGFNSYTRFAIFFKGKTSLTPTQFRKSVLVGEEHESEVGAAEPGTRRRLHLDFGGNRLSPLWKPAHGKWEIAGGCARGQAHETAELQYSKILPENFRITVEARSVPQEDSPSANLIFSLLGRGADRSYCQFSMGEVNNRVNTFRHLSSTRRWNAKAVLAPAQWMRVVLELNDDTMVFVTGNEELFRFRDPFPPPHADRSRFSLWGWRTQVEMRSFELEDLGILPTVPATRIGDSLYNSGLYEKARDFYSRLQVSGTPEGSGAGHPELHYKIGMCYLREGVVEKAKGRMKKGAALVQDTFWSDQAQLGVLEAEWRSGHLEETVRSMRALFSQERLRDDIRWTTDLACMDFAKWGFFDRVVKLRELFLRLDEKESLHALINRRDLADNLKNLKRYDEALAHLRLLLDTPSLPDSICLSAARILIYVQGLCGSLEEARQSIGYAKQKATDPFDLAWIAFSEMEVLRGQGEFEKALEKIAFILKTYPAIKPCCTISRVNAAHILCCLGRIPEARLITAEAEQADPMHGLVRRGSRSLYLYVPLVVERKYNEYAEVIAEDLRAGGGASAEQAELSVRYAMMLELSGKKTEAQESLGETARRYPESRCCFWGGLANRLLNEEKDLLESLPYPAQTRAETFYFTSFLYEARGNIVRSRELLELAVKEDPTLRWPAWLAKQRLRGK